MVKGRLAITAGCAILLTVACLLLSSCGIFDQRPAASAGATVGDTGADLTIDGVHIIVPAGAAPTGTKIEAAFEDHQPTGVDGATLKSLSKAFKIRLGDGLEPAKPLTVTLPIDRSQLLAGQRSETSTTVAMMIQSEGATSPDLVAATWDEASATVTAQVSHLSWLWPTQIDLGSVMGKVRSGILQAIGVEYPKPDCADKPLTIGSTTYTAISPPQAWLCVREENGSLVVTASPDSPIPFLTSPTLSATATPRTEVSLTTGIAVALSRSAIANPGKAVMMPGAAVEYRFEGAPSGDATIRFSQLPAMTLLAILLKVVDVTVGPSVDSKALDALNHAECLGSVVDTSQAGKPLSVEVAAGVVKSFFTCTQTVAEITPIGRVILALLGGAPQFLAAAAIGIVNTFTGWDNFNATVAAVTKAPTASSIIPGMPDTLSGKWCTRSGPPKCFSATDTKQRYPSAVVTGPNTSDWAPGAAAYTICIRLDLGNSCSMASTIILWYFPAGVKWNCKNTVAAENAVVQTWQGCDPDYTSAHDASQPRLVIPPNHQQGASYVDTAPMYRVP